LIKSGTLGGSPNPPAMGIGKQSSPDSHVIDARNNAKLLDALRGVPPERRQARFRCVAAFVDPSAGVELARSGACAGEILDRPRGDLGFGYDPLFLIPGLGRTMAELPLDEKNRLSHRAAAFRALAAALVEGSNQRRTR